MTHTWCCSVHAWDMITCCTYKDLDVFISWPVLQLNVGWSSSSWETIHVFAVHCFMGSYNVWALAHVVFTSQPSAPLPITSLLQLHCSAASPHVCSKPCTASLLQGLLWSFVICMWAYHKNKINRNGWDVHPEDFTYWPFFHCTGTVSVTSKQGS